MTRAMKSSGIEWIGDIPEKWDVRRFKNILRSFKGNIRVGPFGSAIKNEDIQDDGYCIYNQKSVLVNDFTSFDSYINYKKFEELKSFCVLPADMLITTRGTIGKIAFVSDNPKAGIIHPCLIKSSLDFQKINQKFLTYLFNETSITNEQFILASNATTIPVIYSDYLKNIKIPYPPLSEQKAIADYLDDRCGKIDDFIAKQKAVIEKLKEYKQSVITEAVTKGLNPAAPMKSSGVDWIGDIPEDWNIERAKNIFQQSIERGNSDLTLLSATQDYGVYPKDRLEGVVQVKEDTDLSLFKTIHKNYFAISLRSFQGGFEMSDYEGVITPAYSVFYAKINVFHRFFKHLFKSDSFISKINSLTVGIREGKSIQYDDFSNLFIPYPPLSEQNEIADYLDAKCAKIDDFIAKKQTVIDKLTEYKKSLIYECVTGKQEILV